MSDQPKTWAQRLFTRLVSPAGAARMEAESRTWTYRCPHCGFERSVWDAGGVLYKAAGGSLHYTRCPRCGKSAWTRRTWPAGVKKSDVYAAAVAAGTGGPATRPLSERPPVLTWVLAATIWLGLIVAAVFLVGLLAGTLLINPLMQPAVSAGDTFMTALKAGDYAAAYQLCAPALEQQVGGAAGLGHEFQGNQPAQWNWTGRSSVNGVVSLNGALTFADGRKGTVHLTLRQVGNEWKVSGYRFEHT